jgi:GH18 family chitinase
VRARSSFFRAASLGTLAAILFLPRAAESQNVVGYYSSWSIYDRDYHVAEIPAAQLTHINYAFLGISASGECELSDPWADVQKPYPGDGGGPAQGNFRQLQILKGAHPHLKVLLAIGGWTLSSRFSDVALTPASRQTFAESCVSLMATYGFDGLDVDWEFPVSGGLPTNTMRPEDKQNFTLLLAELRARLDAQELIDSGSYSLTAAVAAVPSVFGNYELDQIHGIVDWLAIMAYDFQGSWSAVTSFHNALYAATDDPPSESDLLNGDAAVQAYQAEGVPPSKIVLGVPFYGRGWKNVGATNDGLFQSHGGLPAGTYEPGLFEYRDLAVNYLPTYLRGFHADARVPWLYDASSQIMISYEDPASLAEKVVYAAAEGLAGLMIWELSSDDDLHSLLDGITGTPPSLCPAAAPAGCDAPGKSSISLRTIGMQKLSWTFSRGNAARVLDDFGDPAGGTRYSLCLYDASGLIADAEVPPGFGWSTKGTALRFVGSSVIDKVQLRAGATGKPRVVVKGKGALPPIPTPMTEPLSLTVALVHDAGGVCFADTYTTARTNVAGSFSARN